MKSIQSINQHYVRSKRHASIKKELDLSIVLKSVKEICEEKGFNPVERIINAIENGRIDSDLEVKTCIQLLPYLDSKQVEVKQTNDVNISIDKPRTSEEINSRIIELVGSGEDRALQILSED